MVTGIPTEWGTCSCTVTFDLIPKGLACWKDLIAVGLGSGDIITFDGITGTQTAVLSGHRDSVYCLTFSLDGSLLVSGSFDKTVKLWDVQTGGTINTFHDHTSHIYSVSLSIDCTMIASGSADKTIHLWNIQKRECSHIIKQQGQVYCVIFSPTNPQYLMSISDGKVWKWDINGHQINPPYGSSCVAFSSDGTQFISSQEGIVKVQKTDSQIVVAEFHIANSNTHQYCFSPNGKLVALNVDGTIYIWDITSSDPYIVETCIGHNYDINSLAFSSPSSLISCGHTSVKFWQISTSPTNPAAADLKSTTLALAPVEFITLLANDGIAVSCHIDGVVRIWNISTGCCKESFQTPAKCYHKRDIQLIDNRLIFTWQLGKKVHI